ncbi:MAG: O-antigen ligase family protein [Candidatus Doudnabacteria bacterium]|nr:O-antigen ligase family protein [Candidatus Doudnabacteria bacterium]
MSLRTLADWLRSWSIPALVFLLPWQIVWVVRVQEVHGYVWDLATIRLYGVPLLICGVALLHWRLVVAAFRKAWVASFGALGVLVVWVVVASDSLLALQQATQIVAGVLLFVLLLVRAHRGPSEHKVLWAFLITMCVQAILALIQFGVQEVWGSVLLGVAAHTPGTLGVPVVEALSGRYLRAYGMFPHPNILGAWLAVGAFAALWGVLRFERRWMVLTTGVFALLLAGLVVTFSRSAWLALALAVVVWIISTAAVGTVPYWKRWIGPIVVIGCVAVLLLTGLRPLLETRVGFDSRLEEKSVSERVQFFERGWDLFTQQPVMGYGLGHATVALHEYDAELPGYLLQPPHVVGLVLLIELGVVGLFLLFSLVVWLFHIVRRELTYSTPILIAAVLFLVIISLFDHFLWTLWSGMSLVVVVLSLPLLLVDKRTHI